MSNIKDITGERFGRWTVISKAVPGTKTQRARWLCRCECGAEKIVSAGGLVGRKSASCGCYRNEVTGATQWKHGQRKTRAHITWMLMRQRCSNPNNPGYANYGGRGIKVCDRWSDFSNFLSDMGPRPKGMYIDRIDNNGHYEPSNCRWVTKSENNGNRRNCVLIEHGGKTKTIAQWARDLGIHRDTIGSRLKAGKTFAQAILNAEGV